MDTYGSLEQSESATDEKHILYTAANILRHDMASVKDTSEQYFPSTEMAIVPCGDFVPNKLYDFVSWLINEKSFKAISSCNDEESAKNNLQTISICHSIIAQSRHVLTPITLGLGVRIHHEFGSKELVEELHSLGHSVSYDEVRRFLTSVALDQQSNDVYIPKGLKGPANDPTLIDAAIDNFDQNENTLDGKSTTHAMAAVVYKRCTTDPTPESFVPRVKNKSLKNIDGDDALHRYNKPARRPEPSAITDPEVTDICRTEKCYGEALKKDHLWRISRLKKDADVPQQCPAWTGFNSFVVQTDLPVATVRYLPFVQAPPTELTTIYNILLRLVLLASKLNQAHIMVTADMAIYSKAQQLLWAKPTDLDGKVTMRVGGMHMTMAFLASLGTLYGSGGLLALLSDSGVYSQTTANQMLQGKQYARGLRGIKIVHEALHRIFFEAMESWLTKQNRNPLSSDFRRGLQALQAACSNKDPEKAKEMAYELETNHIPAIEMAIEEFRELGRERSETFAYWDTFLEGGEVLLHMLRAERNGDFELHLQATAEAITWFRAAGRYQYQKYVPIYIAEMKALKNSQPESYKHLCDGGFVVRRSSHHAFNAVATDQALEQTVNKDGKSKGGVIGLTLRKNALTRWLKTRHITAEYVEAFKSMSNASHSISKDHQELGKARLEKDENDVIKVVEMFDHFQNPFDLDSVPLELTNIVTGQVATSKVRTSLNNFLEHENTKCKEFFSSRLLEDTKTKSFWDTEPRTKVVTFDDMSKSMMTKSSEKIMVDSEVLFRRLLVVSRQREVNFEEVLSHELAAISPSLFHDDGSMRKTAKSDLMKKLESSCGDIMNNLTGNMSTAYIIDGMALLQGIKETLFSTFNELANRVIMFIRSLFASNMGIQSVVLVFDRYDVELSIKRAERQRRGDVQQASHVIKGSREVPNYRKFMKISANKAALAAFVSDYVMNTAADLLGIDQSIILAGGFHDGRLAKIVTTSGTKDLQSLFSNQEEADTRMLLHAINLSPTHDRIVVHSDDTDVLVLLLYYTSKNMLGSSVFMHTGHSTQVVNRQRYIPVHSIVESHGKDFCESLPAAHAITGCDTTSSFFKIGKRAAYSKLVEHVKCESLPSLTKFGLNEDVDADVVAARTYILALYGKKARACPSLDKLRYLLASTTDKSASQLPPTDDAFKQHVLRARYQVIIWCQSHVAMTNVSNPVENGWRLADNHYLEPVMYTKEAAPVEVRDLTHLYCTDKNCNITRKCHCVQNGLHCVEFCACGDLCQNAMTMVESDSDGDHD